MRRVLAALSVALLAPAATAQEPPPAGKPQLVVYSARIDELVRPIFERYTQQTGTIIRFVTDKEGPLLQRLVAEGESSPADLLLTVDAGNLWRAAQLGVLQPVQSHVLAANIPAHLRDPENRWFGLSIRARTVVYSTERVDPAQLSTYEALAQPGWRGRLCLRTSKKVYNQSLVAMMLAQSGATAAREVVDGWVANLAAHPFASDNEVMDAIVAGRCDVGLVNTYYYGRMLRERPDRPIALFWPNQSPAPNELGGVHVNVSGAGVTAYSKHRDAAVRFLEWLSGPDAQGLFASLNLEFPANPEVAPDRRITAWGKFRQDPRNLADAGHRQAEAVMLMDRAGYR